MESGVGSSAPLLFSSSCVFTSDEHMLNHGVLRVSISHHVGGEVRDNYIDTVDEPLLYTLRCKIWIIILF